MPVGGTPGIQDVVGAGVAENFFHGGEKIRTDDGVVFWSDVETGVFVADELDGGGEFAEIVDIAGVCVKASWDMISMKNGVWIIFDIPANAAGWWPVAWWVWLKMFFSSGLLLSMSR